MLPSNQDNNLSQRMAAMEKELAALVTAMADIHQLMSEIQVETKKEREINYQELRTWAKSNNSLLTMISSAINAIDALKQKIIELPTSSTEPQKLDLNLEETLKSFGGGLKEVSQKQKIIELPTSSTETQKSNPSLEEILKNLARGLKEVSQKITQLSTTNQSQLTKISESTSQHLSQLEQLKTSTEDDSKGKRYWIAVGGGVILLFGTTWMTISNITPIATKMGWAIEKLARIEKKMGIKTANDNMFQLRQGK